MSSMRARAVPQARSEARTATLARKPATRTTGALDPAPPERLPSVGSREATAVPARDSRPPEVPPDTSRFGFRFANVPLLPPGACSHCPPALPVQARLAIGRVDDPHERQADAMADWVLQPVGAPPPLARALSAPAVSRRCSKCEEEATVRRKAQAGQDTAPAGPAASDAGEALAHPLAEARGAGHPLPQPFRSDMERAFGEDFGRVRLHTDGRATRLNQALHAKAFTHGRDIFFERGWPDLGSGAGRHLMAHELSHVVQQSGSARAAFGLIQRTTHTSSTPTNCHNWRIPLPPWIAGTIAHGQIAALLRIPPQAIPRATKLLMGVPNPPSITPHGFADLWKVDGLARIAEIKSTQTGDRVAQGEARHYVQRHNEWLARAPHTDVADRNYLMGPMATRLLGGGLLDLSAVTSTDLNLGPFWGDPLKNLHIEADALGAVVYWCTGTGLPASPVWYPLFRRLMNELRELLQRGRRALQTVLDGIVEGGRAVARWVQDVVGSVVEWGLEHSRVLAFAALILLLLVAIVALIVSLLLEGPSGGTSTVGVVGSVAALAASASGLLVLLGIGTPNLPTASQNLAMALTPDEQAPATGADYERGTGAAGAPATASAASALIRDPAQDFLAALSPLRDPVAVLRGVSQRMRSVPAGGVDQLRQGASLLERSGDAATARYIRDHMARNGLA